jgi:two-component system response regulator NreC
MHKVKVLVADKDTQVREQICALLESCKQIKLVGDVSEAGTIADYATGKKADVVVMDIDWPVMSDTDVVHMILKNKADTRVVIITEHAYEDRILRSLQAGADSIILKKAMDTELITAILTVYEGGCFLYPSVAKTLVKDYLRQVDRIESDNYYNELTKQEKDVLRQIAEGSSNREIADLICLDINKVRECRANIRKKLAISNRSDLVKYAIRHSFVESSSRKTR